MVGLFMQMNPSSFIDLTTFPQVEKLLKLKPQYQEAIAFVTKRKSKESYRSFMDFFFCELNPEFKGLCQEYYLGEEIPLKKALSKNQVDFYTVKMILAMEVAHAFFLKKRCLPWRCFCQEVDKALKKLKV